MVLYMKVSSDEYELPLAVADSIVDLAKMCEVSTSTIYSWMSHYKNKTGVNKSCPYIKVVIDE